MRKIFNKKRIKRAVAIYLIAMMVVLRGASYTYAIPTAPTAPSAPESPVSPETPTAPTYEGSTPTAPTAPTYGDNESTEEVSPSPAPAQVSPTPTSAPTPTPTTAPATTSSVSPSPTPTPSPTPALAVQSTGGETQNETMSDPIIVTGDANNTGAVINTGVENVLVADEGGVDGGIVIKNTENGSGSTNSGSVTVNDNSTKTQTNTTNVQNDMGLVSDSGHNEANKNMGDTNIQTGDANVTGTIINSVNTNIDGIMVSEFNVYEDTMGDIILDFAGTCVSNCGGGDIAVVNSGNGPDSTNTGTVVVNDNDVTFQQNDANVENNMVLAANTGDNESNKNMGAASIKTGDANVEANVINMVNNNIAGDVVYAVVNIFGDLVGDIIIPLEMLNSCCGGSGATVANTGNGPDSTNTANVELNNNDLINQFNNANIINNLDYQATTGQNGLSKDMGGDASITSGDANIVAQVLNVANTNIIGGNAWLVIVNEAGKWIGKIIGGDGSNLAGSEGFEFIVNDAGDVLAVNEGNGPGSTNTTNVTVNDNDTFTQINNANVVNNVQLSANTGDNHADKNMGGASIETGDAKIVANIVNFVNNNIIGTGKLFVTVVNVFGSWFGDIVPPGYEKPVDDPIPSNGGDPHSPPVANGGGGNTSPSNNGGSSGGGSSSSSSSNASTPTSLVSAIFTKPKLFGTGIGGGELLADAAMDESEDNNSAVAGISDEKKLKINLAYALLGIPAIPLLLFAKKKLVLLRAAAGK